MSLRALGRDQAKFCPPGLVAAVWINRTEVGQDDLTKKIRVDSFSSERGLPKSRRSPARSTGGRSGAGKGPLVRSGGSGRLVFTLVIATRRDQGQTDQAEPQDKSPRQGKLLMHGLDDSRAGRLEDDSGLTIPVTKKVRRRVRGERHRGITSADTFKIVIKFDRKSGSRTARPSQGSPSRFWTWPDRPTQLVPTVPRGNAVPDAPASSFDRSGRAQGRRGASKTAFPRGNMGSRLEPIFSSIRLTAYEKPCSNRRELNEHIAESVSLPLPPPRSRRDPSHARFRSPLIRHPWPTAVDRRGPLSPESKAIFRPETSLKHGLTGQGHRHSPRATPKKSSAGRGAHRRHEAATRPAGVILLVQIAILSVRTERAVEQESAMIAIERPPRRRRLRRGADRSRPTTLFGALGEDPRSNLRKLRKSPEGVDRHHRRLE